MLFQLSEPGMPAPESSEPPVVLLDRLVDDRLHLMQDSKSLRILKEVSGLQQIGNDDFHNSAPYKGIAFYPLDFKKIPGAPIYGMLLNLQTIL